LLPSLHVRFISPPLLSRHLCFLPLHAPPPDLHSFPTRRSSDLQFAFIAQVVRIKVYTQNDKSSTLKHHLIYLMNVGKRHKMDDLDRKSTRLNSSHVSISYAVVCLKKKK